MNTTIRRIGLRIASMTTHVSPIGCRAIWTHKGQKLVRVGTRHPIRATCNHQERNDEP